MINDDRELERLLAEKPFRNKKFHDKLQDRVIMEINNPKQSVSRRGSIIKLAMLAVILVGAGAFAKFYFEQNPASTLPGAVATNTPEPDPQPTNSPEAVEAEIRTLATTENGEYRIYVDKKREVNGGYSQVYIERDDGYAERFDWQLNDYNPVYPPTLQLVDLNEDAVEELLVILRIKNQGGGYRQEAHVLKTNDLSEIPVQQAGVYLNQNIQSRIIPAGEYTWIQLNVEVRMVEKAVESRMLSAFGDHVDFNLSINYRIAERPLRLYASVDAVVGEGEERLYLGAMDVSYAFTEQGIVVDNMNFQEASEFAGEVPLYAIRAGEEYVAIPDWDNEIDLVALLGEPLTESTKQLVEDAGPFTGSYTRTLTYDGLELSLHSADGEKFSLIGIRVWDNRYMTSLGLRVGDTAQRVEEAYPFIRVAKDGREPPKNYSYIYEQNRAISIMVNMKDGIVDEIDIQYMLD